jgi:hypothetical protein
VLEILACLPFHCLDGGGGKRLQFHPGKSQFLDFLFAEKVLPDANAVIFVIMKMLAT